MDDTTLTFLSGLGVAFSLGFLGLTAAWAYLVLRLRERAREALHAAGALSPSSPRARGADPDGADPDGADPDGADPDGADPDGADPPKIETLLGTRRAWSRLVALRADLAADADRAAMVAGSVPVLALLGTVLGFFFALGRTGEAGLGAADPIAILEVMLDAGMDTALATTVAGQALYLMMSLAYAAFVTGVVERADVTLEESLARARGPGPSRGRER